MKSFVSANSQRLATQRSWIVASATAAPMKKGRQDCDDKSANVSLALEEEEQTRGVL